MALDRLEKNMGIISTLDDEPNDVGGLSAKELKEKFDEAGEAVKDYLNNTLLPSIEGQDGAASIGAKPFEGVDGTTVQEQIEQINEKIGDVVLGQIPDGSITPEKLAGGIRSYYRYFKAEEWMVSSGGAKLKIQASVHKLPTRLLIVSKTVHMLVGRSAVEYGEGDVGGVKALLIDCMEAALAANTTTAGTYPVAADGHVELTWEQVQHYLLEGELVNAATAQIKSVELGFNWKERDTTGVEKTVELDELLAATYTPALGGASNTLDELLNLAVIQGLRFRKAVAGVTGWKAKYDLDGRMNANTWGVMETSVQMDTETGELVVSAGSAYEGELLVIAAP